MSTSGYGPGWRPPLPLAVILGTNEIASAVATYLHRDGHGVVLSHDPLPPVIRRKMAFHDALFEDAVTIDGITASRIDTGIEIRASLGQVPGVIITQLGLLDLFVIQTPRVLVDARMQKYQTKADLRRLAQMTIGLGPGYCAGTNCDVAIETRPGKAGRIVTPGPTDAPDGVARRLGRISAERFAYAQFPGRWHTAVEIGTRIFKDFVVGHLGSTAVRAPFDGILRGAVRDGTEVPAGAKLLEIDPRGRGAVWKGIDARAQRIARGVAQAIASRRIRIESNTQRSISKMNPVVRDVPSEC